MARQPSARTMWLLRYFPYVPSGLTLRPLAFQLQASSVDWWVR
eukprot:SAG11_NODE_19177_length_472_cov_1.386059_1_plen_42_part_01